MLESTYEPVAEGLGNHQALRWFTTRHEDVTPLYILKRLT